MPRCSVTYRLLVLACLATGLGSCADFGAFHCADASDCDAGADGRCEQYGWCSYSDASCESDRRYGPHAGDGLAGECVDVDPDPTGDDGGTGDIDPCDGVACSGLGECVVVDESPTCQCTQGTYRSELACLEDPCVDGSTCRYVDAQSGDDDADGSLARPWQTLDAVSNAQLQPNTFVLLRRGLTYDAPLQLSGVVASMDAPVTIGAWGPRGEQEPALTRGVAVSDSQGVVLRDLTVTASAGACVVVERTAEVVGRNLDIHDCPDEGVRVVDGSSHTVWLDNVITQTGAAGLTIRDTVDSDTDIHVGSHHYIVDNAFSRTSGLFVLVRDGVGDAKILGNTIVASGAQGIASNQDFGWVVSNTVGGLDDGAGESGRPHALLIDYATSQQIEANVFFDSGVGAQLDLASFGLIERNTFVFTAPDVSVTRPLWLQPSASPQELIVRRNLLVSEVDEVVTIAPDTALAVAEDNAFMPRSGTCTFDIGGETSSFSEWQDLGHDLSSTCGPIPGVEGSREAGTDPSAVGADGFFSDLIPDPTWARCDAEIGAFDCNGTRHEAALRPFEQAQSWEGPLDVWQRYGWDD